MREGGNLWGIEVLSHLKIRPKLGRSCRCMKIKGDGYESVVDCVSIFSRIIKAITIGDYNKRSLGNIKVHLVTERLPTGPYGTIRDHMVQYGKLREHTGPYGSIQDHAGPNRTISDHT